MFKRACPWGTQGTQLPGKTLVSITLRRWMWSRCSEMHVRQEHFWRCCAGCPVTSGSWAGTMPPPMQPHIGMHISTRQPYSHLRLGLSVYFHCWLLLNLDCVKGYVFVSAVAMAIAFLSQLEDTALPDVLDMWCIPLGGVLIKNLELCHVTLSYIQFESLFSVTAPDSLKDVP
jgi:hypothetical protein